MDINTFIDKLINTAKAQGLNECEAYYSEGSSFRVMVNKGEVVQYKVNDSNGLSFRVKIGEQIGYSYTQAFDDKAIDMLLEQAADNAKILESKDEQFIFEGSDKYEELDIYNEKLDSASAQSKIQLALDIEKNCLAADERIQSVAYCIVGSSSGSTRIKNSKGLDVSFASNSAVAWAVPVANDGERSYTGGHAMNIHDFDNFDLDTLVKVSTDRALSQIGAQQAASGTYDVVFEYDCATDLLNTYATIFSADSAQKGYSLLAGKEGEKIASDIVSIIDDPLHPDGPSTSPFDDEGVATYKKTVVENGVLKTLLHNLKTANKAGVQSTGNATKASYNSAVGVSPTNFYIKPNKDNSIDDLLKEMKNGLMLVELDGLHAANPLSGDFSVSARGFFVENGNKIKPVEQITVSGNYYTLLKNIAMLANDVDYKNLNTSSVACPSILVKGMNIAGL